MTVRDYGESGAAPREIYSRVTNNFPQLGGKRMFHCKKKKKIKNKTTLSTFPTSRLIRLTYRIVQIIHGGVQDVACIVFVKN